jgi:thiazole synthase/sulfur carrier protein
MDITLNNRPETFERESITVSELLELKRFTFRLRVVKVNGILIPKEKQDSTLIHNGDNVQILYLMSGG